jgi:hypothetical protein
VSKVFLPFRGEFGWLVMMHAPQVRACHDDDKVVCCEPGCEALYPGVSRYVPVDRRDDDDRHGLSDREFLNQFETRMRRQFGDAQYIRPDRSATREYFTPWPHEAQVVTCDIVVCPRWRNYGFNKNWPHWSQLVEYLDGYKLLAAGAPDSSVDVACPKAWSYARFLDASIEAMLLAKLVIATDAGLAHLAVMCGTPLLMITHANGLVAPGPVVESDGREAATDYWPVHMDRYERENHCDVDIRQVHDAWENPAIVAVQAKDMMQ